MLGDVTQRKQAIEIMKDAPQKEDVDALVFTLHNDKIPHFRAKAAWAIGELKDEKFLDDIMQACEDSHPLVRRTAAWAIGVIGSAKGIPALKKLVADEDRGVAVRAENALKKLMFLQTSVQGFSDCEGDVDADDTEEDTSANAIEDGDNEKTASSNLDDIEVVRTLLSSIQSACLTALRKDGKFDITRLQDAASKVGKSLGYKPLRNYEFERYPGRKAKVDMVWLDEKDFPVLAMEFSEELVPSRIVKLTDLAPAYAFLITPMMENVDFVKFVGTVALSRKDELQKGNFYIHMLDYRLGAIVGRGENVMFVDLRRVLNGDENYIFGIEQKKPALPAGTTLFPFEVMRAGQREFIADVVEAVNNARHIVAHAPTGLGKTVSSLTPAVEYALKNKKMVFFLTSKQSQHRIVVDTLKAMQKKANGQNMKIVAVDVISKQSMCPRPEANMFGGLFSEFCKMQQKTKSCKYFSKNNANVLEELKKNIMHVEDLKKYCTKNGVCPWKTALDAAKGADIIVCDYNYVFSDINEVIFPRIGRTIEDAILIVDEAHNLPDRIRGELSGELSPRTLEEASRELKKRDKLLSHHLMKLSAALEDFVITELGKKEGQSRISKDKFVELVNDVLRQSLEPMMYDTLSNMLAKAGEGVLEELESSYSVQVAQFLDGWMTSDEVCLKTVQNSPFPSISYRLLDPSVISKEVFARVHSSIIMSGTLVPTEMYADLLGIEKGRVKLAEYLSPFPKENRLNIIDTEVTTSYQARDETMFRSIGDKITQISSAVPGNLAVFFPSYELLERTLPHLRGSAMLVREERNMSKAEKAQLFDSLVALRKSKRPGMLLGVQGGSLSEGIDYSDNLLGGVVVVGMPLSPPTVESEALISYYERKFGEGKGVYYGYINPAMNKVMQACGRVIRSETDRGVVVLMDKRFEWGRYAKCFPKDFSATRSKKPEVECRQFYST